MDNNELIDKFLKDHVSDELVFVVEHIKNLNRLNAQLKDKVLFEKEYGLVDYSKLDKKGGRLIGDEWVGQWRKTYDVEPKLT